MFGINEILNEQLENYLEPSNFFFDDYQEKIGRYWHKS